MTMTLRLEGTLLSCVRNQYGEFTDSATGDKRPGGTSYRAWVGQDFGSDPCRVTLKVDQLPVFEALEREGLGTKVAFAVTPGSKGDVRLVSVLAAGSGNVPATAGSTRPPSGSPARPVAVSA